MARLMKAPTSQPTICELVGHKLYSLRLIVTLLIFAVNLLLATS